MQEKNQDFKTKITLLLKNFHLYYLLIIFFQILIIYLLDQQVKKLKNSPCININSSSIDCGLTDLQNPTPPLIEEQNQFFSSTRSRYYYPISCNNKINLSEKNKIYYKNETEAQKDNKTSKQCP